MPRAVEAPDNLGPAESAGGLAGETPVVTRCGVRQIRELVDGTHELLTSEGEWVKASVLCLREQPLSVVTLSRSGVRKALRAAAQHRWSTRTRRGKVIEQTTASLCCGDRLTFAFPRRPDDRLVAFDGAARGVVFGDGSSNRYRSVANLCGAKDVVLLPLFAEYSAPRRYGSLLRVHGLPLAWKRDLPSLDSESSYLYGWLAGYFAADGDVDRTGRPTLSSASREHLEFVRLACAQVGVGTYGIRSRTREGFGTLRELHCLGLMRGDLDSEFFLIPSHRARFEAGHNATERRGWNVLGVAPTGRADEVFSAVVPDTNAFVLEDNIATHAMKVLEDGQNANWPF